ncbi:MAG: type II methionyl aminopeptidase [Thermoplasmata archaeon]|nr:type II methionyl aminopeptidase [Thermoplasmata archaeon]
MYDKFKLAGKIAGNALKYGISIIDEGVSYIEVAEKVESYILKNAKIAFPVNISVNSIAAHYTPNPEDKYIFRRGDVVKLDVGAHVNGYIGDTAATVEIGSNEYEKLIEASKMALENAISIVKAGVKVADISKEIEKTINSYGYRPIRNLQGHSIEQYKLHAGLSIPNHAYNGREVLKEGDVVAIEPFATNGEGYVIDDGKSNIYQVIRKSQAASDFIRHFGSLPFAERWIYRHGLSKIKLNFMVRKGIIHSYNILIEAKGGMVSQREHTIMVTTDGCEVLTE